MRHTTRLSKAFGKIVRELRIERGLSQEQLASHSRIHRTYVSDLERGLKSPTLTVIAGIATSLGVSPTELVRRAEGRNS